MYQYRTIYSDELTHHGILGQKWGIRRYQNPDGSLTAEGRKHLGLDDKTISKNRFSEDIVIKKGTEGSRVIRTRNSQDWWALTDKEKKEDEKELFDVEKKLTEKYISVNSTQNGGYNGTEFYLSWFTDHGWSPKGVYVDEIKVNKDLKIASGQKVLDRLLKESGQLTMEDIERKTALHKLSMEYTNNTELKNKINNDLKAMGYDGVEDINDLDTDLPIIVFNSDKNLTITERSSAEDYIKKHYRR